jgi:hypothetical protein
LETRFCAHHGHLSTPFFKILIDFKNEIDEEILEFESIERNIEKKNISLKFGGRWSPADCVAKYRIAIITPYRNRLPNLKQFLNNMHPFFSRQKINYGVYIIEPLADVTFNRGLLMNIGFLEALKDSYDYWDCFFFHDVDMIPKDIRNLYSCDDKLPVHYAVTIDKWEFR